MGTVIIIIGVILLTTFGVYLARKTAVGLKDGQPSSHGIAENDDRFSSRGSIENSTVTQQRDFRQEESSQIAGAFRGVGIVCFVLAVLVPLLLLIGGNGQTIFAAAIFLVLALSGLGWLGVGVIIRLLEEIAQNTEK